MNYTYIAFLGFLLSFETIDWAAVKLDKSVYICYFYERDIEADVEHHKITYNKLGTCAPIATVGTTKIMT